MTYHTQDQKNAQKVNLCWPQELFNSGNNGKKHQEPKVLGEVRGKNSGIGDAVSQIVGPKIPMIQLCSTVTLQPTFWGHSVKILSGRTILPLLGLSIT